MKKILFLFIAISFIFSSSFAQKAIEDYENWKGARRLPMNQNIIGLVTGTGQIFERPTPDEYGTVSPASVKVKILLEDGTVADFELDKIEQRSQGNDLFPERGINYKIFDKPVYPQHEGVWYYRNQIKVTVYIYTEVTFDGGIRKTQYIVL